MALMMLPLLWLGLFPQPLIDRVEKTHAAVQETAPDAHGVKPAETSPAGRRT